MLLWFLQPVVVGGGELSSMPGHGAWAKTVGMSGDGLLGVGVQGCRSFLGGGVVEPLYQGLVWGYPSENPSFNLGRPGVGVTLVASLLGETPWRSGPSSVCGRSVGLAVSSSDM